LPNCLTISNLAPLHFFHKLQKPLKISLRQKAGFIQKLISLGHIRAYLQSVNVAHLVHIGYQMQSVFAAIKMLWPYQFFNFPYEIH
jgi:hypothetical protein